MNWFPTRWRCDAHAVWRAGGVLVGRGAADPGAGAAGGSGAAGSGAARRGAVEAGGASVGVLGARAWPSVDLDRDVRAVDGDQAAHGLGLRNADAGGLRLAAPAALLPDRARSACAGGVHGQKASPQAGCRGRARDHQGGDLQGPARDAFPCAGGEDRLDGRGGGHPLPLRRDARPARRSGARTRGSQGDRDDQRQDGVGQGSFAFSWAGCPCDLKDTRAPHRPGQDGGDEAQRARRAADRTLGERGTTTRWEGQGRSAWPRRPGQAQSGQNARGSSPRAARR